MLRSRTVLALLALCAVLAGCSGSGGGGILRYPKGDISISAYPGGQSLNSTKTTPYAVTSAFSIAISETDFGGPYSVTMYSYNTNFNVPCFEPHDASGGTIFTFEPDNATVGGSPNPCAGADDVETALITDGKGHDDYFTFVLTAPIVASSAPTPMPSSSSGSTSGPCSQGDPNSSSITVTGAVQPFSFPPCNDFTITAVLPANSGNDTAGLASSAATQFDVTPDATAGTPILSLEFEPHPSQIALTNGASSLTVTVASPTKIGGAQYTMALSENGQVIEEITQISPSDGQISFNVHPLSGVFDNAEYVAVVYKN